MSDDKLQTSVPSSSTDEPSPSHPSASSHSSGAPMTLTKFDSLTNRLPSPDNVNSSTSPPTRRTFNICDILAKPSSLLAVENSEQQRRHIHRLKLLIDQKSCLDGDDDDDGQYAGSISDCEVSGKTNARRTHAHEHILFR